MTSTAAWPGRRRSLHLVVQRGKAFDNDTGWRIDYHLATPALAAPLSRQWWTGRPRGTPASLTMPRW